MRTYAMIMTAATGVFLSLSAGDTQAEANLEGSRVELRSNGLTVGINNQVANALMDPAPRKGWEEFYRL
jgi:hypothetical protein